MVIHLFLTLEDAVEYVSHLCSHRVSYDALHTITSEITVGSHSLRQLGYLIAVGSEVGCYIVTEIAYAVAVAEVQLYSVILHLTCINPHRTTLAHSSYSCHIEKYVLSVLVIVVEATVKGVVEEREIYTDVGLCCSFPLNVVVANLYSLEARLQYLSSIGACDVVGCTKAISTEV